MEEKTTLAILERPTQRTVLIVTGSHNRVKLVLSTQVGLTMLEKFSFFQRISGSTVRSRSTTLSHTCSPNYSPNVCSWSIFPVGLSCTHRSFYKVITNASFKQYNINSRDRKLSVVAISLPHGSRGSMPWLPLNPFFARWCTEGDL